MSVLYLYGAHAVSGWEACCFWEGGGRDGCGEEGGEREDDEGSAESGRDDCAVWGDVGGAESLDFEWLCVASPWVGDRRCVRVMPAPLGA